ncbi:hypothetical protein PVK06_047768 [Gossypium arboreum]|uniref:Uncharacterized protein n=1 Tax=Gossypium arboreum TaxID=29729 RepID=A0ABR0MEG2_GOSAR|nr:hypothetical protein PVK06_047768 [Gossypium arboreum]
MHGDTLPSLGVARILTKGLPNHGVKNGFDGRGGDYSSCGNRGCGSRFMNEGTNHREQRILGVQSRESTNSSEDLEDRMDIGSLLQSVRQENISSPASKGSGNAHKWLRTTNEAVSTETRSKWEEEELESLREARRKKGKDPVVPSKVINMIPSSFTLSIVPISEAVLVGRSFGIVQSFVSTFPSGSLKLVSSNEEQNIVFLWRAKLDRK